jgi:hypothetical protein
MKELHALYSKPFYDYVRWSALLNSKAYATTTTALTAQYRISYAGCSMFACVGFLITRSTSKLTPDIQCGLFLGKKCYRYAN